MESTQRGAVTTITIDISETPEQWLYLTSDLHIDSAYCERGYLEQDLKEAKRRNAQIFFFGDTFDAMQGRFDPRRSMAELRPEYRREDYYDFVIRDVGKILSEYSPNIAVISDGNHELSVLKNANTNLADRLVERLNNNHKGNIKHGGYGGWVRFMWERKGNPQRSIRLKYHHGSGGEAPVTRGAIQTNRQAVYLPDADIVVNGHSHHGYHMPIVRERISNKGEQYFDVQHHIRTPGYKQSYGDGSTGWDITRGGVPKPIGGAWVRMYWNNATNRAEIEVTELIHQPNVLSPVNDVYTGISFPQE